MMQILKAPRARQWIQAIILLGMGLYFLTNMLSGRILFYINDRFSWLTWLGTLIILALAIISVYDLLRRPTSRAVHAEQAHHDHDHHDHRGHDAPDHHDHHDHNNEHIHVGHTHGQPTAWRNLLIVAIPLVLGIVVPAKPLGASAVGSSGITTSVKASGNSTAFTSLASTDRNVLDWVRAFTATDNIDQFNGQVANVLGFVYRDIRFQDAPQKFMVARFAISCCVADASALGVVVQSEDGAKLTQDSWVRVKGKFQVQKIDGQQTPVLVAESIEPTAQPEHPYLYP